MRSPRLHLAAGTGEQAQDLIYSIPSYRLEFKPKKVAITGGTPHASFDFPFGFAQGPLRMPHAPHSSCSCIQPFSRPAASKALSAAAYSSGVILRPKTGSSNTL